MSKFCDSHKRWFEDDGYCSHCAYENYQRLHDEALEKERRPFLYNAAFCAAILTKHVTCGHLITDDITCPDGSIRSVLELQMLAFEYEYEEVR